MSQSRRRPSILRSLDAFSPTDDGGLSRDRCEVAAQQLCSSRGTELLFADIVGVQWRKSSKMDEALVAVDDFGLLFLQNDKLLFSIHLLEINSIVTSKVTEVVISSTVDVAFVNLSNHAQSKSNIGDDITHAIALAWSKSFPTALTRPFQILIPDSRAAALRIEPVEIPLICGGFVQSYNAACFSLPSFITPREDLLEMFELLHAQGIVKLRTAIIPNLDQTHLTALLLALKFNLYFVELSMERPIDTVGQRKSILQDASSVTSTNELFEILQPKYVVEGDNIIVSEGILFDEAAATAFVGVLGYNRKLVRVSAPSVGLNQGALLKLRESLLEQATQATINIKWLDISDNNIGDAGIETLAEIFTSLPYMPTALGLARLGGTRKAKSMVSLLTAFRRNVFTSNALTALNLSDNKFDQDTSVALAAWIALPNAIQALGLANTGVMIEKVCEALARGCVSQLRSLDLSRNAIKSCNPLLTFIKASQSLQILDLSHNPLAIDSVQDLIRTIIVNFSLFDVELHLGGIGLDLDGAELLLGMISNNIKKLTISDNALGAQGLEVVGNGMAINSSLVDLRVDRCFFAPKKQSRFIESFCTFLRSNSTLKYLSMRGNTHTCLKGDLIPIVEDLAKSKLVAVDIAGHDAGDGLGVALGRLLKTNQTLLALDYDFNGLGAQGLVYIRDGLEHNSTIRSLPIPVHDIAASVKMSKQTRSQLTAIARAIETKMAANAAKISAVPSRLLNPSLPPPITTTGQEGASSTEEIEAVGREDKTTFVRPPLPSRPSGMAFASARPLTLFSGGDLKYINPARQKELDNMVYRVRCTGRTPTLEQEQVFSDVAYTPESLAALQTHQEAILEQLNSDLRTIAEKLAQDAVATIGRAHEQVRNEVLNTLGARYKSFSPDLQASLASSLDTLCPPFSSEFVSKGASDLVHLSWRRLEAEASKVLMNTYANFVYDGLQANMEGILNGIILEARDLSDAANTAPIGTVRGSLSKRGLGSIRGKQAVLQARDSSSELFMLPDEDWDSSGDELEKIMASGVIDQDKMRHQLLFGFPVRVHNLEGTKRNTGAQCQLYLDVELKKMMWRRPYQKHTSEDVIVVADITGVHAGKDMGKYFRDYKNLPDSRCFSILTQNFTLDLEAPTSKQRAKWVYALQLLVGGLIKSEGDEQDEQDYEFVDAELAPEDAQMQEDTEEEEELDEEEEIEGEESEYYDDDDDDYDDEGENEKGQDIVVGTGQLERSDTAKETPQPPASSLKPSLDPVLPRPLPPVPTTTAPIVVAPAPEASSVSVPTKINPAERPLTNVVASTISIFGSSIKSLSKPAPAPEQAPSAPVQSIRIHEASAQAGVAQSEKVPPLPETKPKSELLPTPTESVTIPQTTGSGTNTGLTHLNLARPSGPKRRRPAHQKHYRDVVAAASAGQEDDDLNENVAAGPEEVTPASSKRKASGGAHTKYGKPQADGDLTQEFMSRVKAREEAGVATSRLTKSGEVIPAPKAHTSRLYILKGRRAIRPRQVECTYQSLNDGDAFVLDAPKTVFVWYGRHANKIERGAAAKFGTDYKNEVRKGLVNVTYVEPHSTPSVHKAFWEALGSQGEIASEEQGGNDIVVENAVKISLVLTKFTQTGSNIETSRVNEGGQELVKEMIEYGSATASVLDGGTEIYVWESKGATKLCRDAAKEHALSLAKSRPNWTLFESFREGQESLLFRLKFADWPEPGKEAEMKRRMQGLQRRSLKSFDLNIMFAAAAAADTGEKKKKADAGWFDTHELVTVDKYDNGQGTLQIWMVNDKSKLVPVPSRLWGRFHAGECYVLSYVWTYKDKQRCQLYCWQGRSCNGNKKGSGMLLMQEKLEDHRRSKAFYEDPVSRRLLQFKENDHFKKLFDGRLVYLLGLLNLESESSPPIQLFHLKPRSSAPTRDVVGVEVELSAAGLNSRDVFVAHTSSIQFVWVGAGVQPDERAMAVAHAGSFRGERKQEVMTEGKEKSTFWSALGGQEHYASAEYLKDPQWEPKLFECSLSTGEFTAERMMPFTQDDLSVEYVYILDAFHEIYVWVGSSAPKELINMTMKIAVDYQRLASDGRTNDDSAVLFVQSGAEPLMFTCNFLGWNGLAQLRNRQQQRRAVRELLEQQERKYPYKELIKRPPPSGLDVSRLETYLEDAEFQEVFQMPPIQFAKLPDWIRTNKKIELGLY